MRVRRGKGDKARSARLAVGDWLGLWRGGAPGPLFPGLTGERLLRTGLSAAIRTLGRRCGVEVHPHLLRHTFATQFLRAGGDLATLQLLLGHETLEMARHYTAALADEDALVAHEAASPGDTLGLTRKRPRRGR